MRFTKMHGAGNDYVYVNCFEEPIPADPAPLARAMADRHFGVGGDGLVLICPSERADARMRMFNADGSEAEMCGNALRCVARYLHDHAIAPRERLSIETGAGILTADLELRDGQAERVQVNMGPPRLEADAIPVAIPGVGPAERVVDHPLAALAASAGLPNDWAANCRVASGMTCVSMGNPHLVLFASDIARLPLEHWGPKLETAALFPRKINVHFVEVHDRREVTMRTWERGSGITLACGTGASAVCVAGALVGRTDRHLLAHLPGGDLELDWRDDDCVYMTGPAVEVFSGEWPQHVQSSTSA